jgi:hypothetical protein
MPYAMTGRGYSEVLQRLNQCGYDLPDDPDHRVNITMLSTAEKILKQDLNPVARYSSLFTKETTDEDKAEIDKINKLMQMILPDIYAGKEPDIEAAARKAGVYPETARDLVKQVLGKLGK